MAAAGAIALRLPDGAAGTRETLKAMRLLALDGKRLPMVRATALDIIRDVPPKDELGELQAVWRWVRDNFHYRADVDDVETLHFADQLLRQRAGDCDDASVLIAALLGSIGYLTRFTAMAFAGDDGYGHVVPEAWHAGAWVPLDATVDESFGWFPDNVVAEMRICNVEC